jgi:hypothetical protein
MMINQVLTVLLLLVAVAIPAELIAQDSPSPAATGSGSVHFHPLHEASAAVPALRRSIRVDLRGVTLEEALRSIAQQAELGLTYNRSLEGLQKSVTLTAASISVAEALATVLRDSGLELLISASGQTVVRQTAPGAAAGASRTQSAGMVAGVVREANSGRPIGSARVSLVGTRIAALSDPQGRFALRNVPPGSYTLQATSIGYDAVSIENVGVRVDATTTTNVLLSAAVIPIEALVITPGRFGVMRENAAAPQTLGRETIETMPGLGEDIYRTIHRLPGVAADDYSAKFAVRGGGHDELLVRLDGLTLFEPFHLKDLDGALSIVDVQAIGGIDLTTGGFSAEYGSRLTGVFDMSTLRQPVERNRTTAGISLSNARMMSVGAFDENRGQWLLSARRGYLDVLLKLIDGADNFSPRYHDALGKLEYQLSPRHVVSANVLTSGDALVFKDDDFTLNSTYGNHYAWVNWRAYPSTALSVQTVFSAGRLGWARHADGGSPATEITELRLADERDFHFAGVQQDWSWRMSDRNLAKWGAGVRGSWASYDYLRWQTGEATEGRPISVVDTIRVEATPRGVEIGAYMAHRVHIAEPLTVEAGLRYDHYSQSRDDVVSPRLNLAVALGRRTTLRGAWGLYYQPQEVYQLQAYDGDFTFYPVERAEHRVLGIDHTLTGGANVRVEAYQRVLSQVRPRYVNLFNGNSAINEALPDRIRLEPREGEALGIELFASNEPQSGKVRWFGSYTYASVEDVIDGQKIARGVDQRHSALLELGYRPTPLWSLAVSWQIRSGRPYTESTIRTDTLPGGEVKHVYHFGAVYGERLPAYHRMDLRATRRFTFGQSHLAVFLDVFNLYDRKNPRGAAAWIENHDGTISVETEMVPNLPRLPSIGVSWEF